MKKKEEKVMQKYYDKKEKAFKKAKEIKTKTGFMPKVYSVKEPNGKIGFFVSMPKVVNKEKKSEKKPTGFGLLNTSIPGAGIGSGFGFSGESKIDRLKKKEKELKQQAITWKAEAEVKKLR